MLFKPELINKIVLGEKTQTRRPVKSTDPTWRVGKTYAVQPGRGQSGVWWNPQTKEWLRFRSEYHGAVELLRIRILEIDSQDVRDISHADSIAEGFNTECDPKGKFLEIWCGFYDPIMLVTPLMKDGQMDSAADHKPRHISLSDRPLELYMGWVLKFEIA